jgi:CheY-like chemotaxis protein
MISKTSLRHGRCKRRVRGVEMMTDLSNITVEPTLAPVRSKRILLAEDDDEMRALLASALTRDGYQVVEATDGEALVEAVVRSLRDGVPVDLLVTDIRMPGLTGFEAVAWVRALGCRAPIIAITAFADRRAHLEAVRRGMVRMLGKPFEVDELRDTIRDLFAANPKPRRPPRGTS